LSGAVEDRQDRTVVNERLPVAAEEYVAALVRGVPDWVRGVAGPIWCVVLGYTDPGSPWPYVQAERLDQRVERHRRNVANPWLEPVHHLAYAGGMDLPFLDPPAHEAPTWEALILRASEALRERGQPSGPTTLREAARRLNYVPRERWTAVTDDFVVYAAHVEADDLVDGVVASVPSDRLTIFRQRGWL
jgi:hypothetical protein